MVQRRCECGSKAESEGDAVTRICTIDGGGLFGNVPAEVLLRLAALYPALLVNVDVLSGSSIGAIMAVLLAAGVPLETIANMLATDGGKIFATSFVRDASTVDGLAAAKYDNAALHAILSGLLGSKTLGDLDKDIVVPVFILDNHNLDPLYRMWCAQVFTRFSAPEMLAADLCMMASAAPTYFTAYNGGVDSGVATNNPSALALGWARHCIGADVALLSLGTGQTLQYVDASNSGAVEALTSGLVPGGVLKGGQDIMHQICAWELGDQYRRIQPTFLPGQFPAMDDPTKVPTFVQLGQTADLLDVPAWLAKMDW